MIAFLITFTQIYVHTSLRNYALYIQYRFYYNVLNYFKYSTAWVGLQTNFLNKPSIICSYFTIWFV